MKKVLVLSLLLLCFTVSMVYAVERSPLRVGVGGCYIGGTPGVAIDMLSDTQIKDLYLRVGLGLTDSKAESLLSENKDYRKFTPLFCDAVYYLDKNSYIGGGLNYSLKVSDSEIGNFGVDLYLGMENDIGIPAKLVTEIGYSSLNRLGKDNFEGCWLMVGLRYDLVPVSNAPAAVTPTPAPAPAPAPAPEVAPAPAPEVVPAPIVAPAATPEVAPVATPETVTPPAPKATPEELAAIRAEIAGLEADLVKAQSYVNTLDQKIAAAAGDQAKLSTLNSLKSDAVLRVNTVQQQLDSKKAQESTMQQ